MNYAELKLFFLWAAVLDIDRRGGNESGMLLSRYWRSYGRDIPWCNIDGVTPWTGCDIISGMS